MICTNTFISYCTPLFIGINAQGIGKISWTAVSPSNSVMDQVNILIEEKI